jgi:glutamine amidotransferase
LITIVDYGSGNLGSVANMFKRIGVPSRISGDPEVVSLASKILLPGVGSFDAAMSSLRQSRLLPVLEHKARVEKVPILGICLGMQLLTRGSQEGELPGLNWIPADTLKFSFEDRRRKVPHMGWNLVERIAPCPLTCDLPEDSRFYFVHSYYVRADEERFVLLRSHYGHPFDSAITNGENIYGAQFHPEKSHKFGMRLLEGFARI